MEEIWKIIPDYPNYKVIKNIYKSGTVRLTLVLLLILN